MREHILAFIQRTLNTRVTPLAYLVAAQGLVYGIAFTFLTNQRGVRNTILFKEGALVGAETWGVIALISSAILIFGLSKREVRPVQMGSFGMFIVWTFAAIVYLSGGYLWFLLPLALLEILGYGYFYLASSLEQLWDYTPHRD